MKPQKLLVAIPCQNENCDELPETSFGRSPAFIFVDTGSGNMTTKPNPGREAISGAGTETATFVINCGVQAVIASQIGINAIRVLHAAGVEIFELEGENVDQILDRYQRGILKPLEASW